MKNYIKLLNVLLLLVSIAGNSALAQSKNERKAQRSQSNVAKQQNSFSKENFIDSVNKFSLRLFNQVVDDNKTQNVFISPLSLSFVLGSLDIGASGQTRTDLNRVLYLPNYLTNQSIGSLYNDLLKTEELDSVTFNITNGLFLNKNFRPEPSYIDSVKKYFNTRCENIDFARANVPPVKPNIASKNDLFSNFTKMSQGFFKSKKVDNTPDLSLMTPLQRINYWVSQNTNNKIPKVLDNIDPTTDSILIDVAYFKGRWTDPFESTHLSDFFVNKSETIKVDMMRRAKFTYYYSTPNFECIKLGYGIHNDYQNDLNSQVSAYVLLPAENYNLSNLCKILTTENLNKWIDSCKGTGCMLEMPRFKISTAQSFNKYLSKLGTNNIFAKPDFSLITKSPFKVGDIIQKTFLEVDETGTEAAAASVSFACTAPQCDVIVTVDRPFIFIIRDDNSKAILFIGSITRPEKF